MVLLLQHEHTEPEIQCRLHTATHSHSLKYNA